MTPGATANQTIFLRGYSISVREDSSLLVKLGLKNPVETFKIDERKSKAPWFRSSVPYSAAPQSSTTPAATETGTSRTTQGDSAGMERGASLFNFDDLEIERSLYDEYSGSEVSESSEDESETDTSVMDIPYGHTTMQADTLVQHLPGRGKIINPSGLINHHILDIHPGATIALTHDDFEWTDMENDVRNPLNVMELVKYAIDNNLVSIDKSLTTPNAWVAKRRDTVIQRFSRQKDIFALVIGIDKYQCKEYTDLQGACSDADNFEAYLVESLRTPKANIISLRDGKATRSAIIDKLIRMKDNANIQQDMAAIIIYFAGYGATTNNPAGRSIDDTSDMKIEMLCMTDIGILDKSNKVVNGIPAKTINQLLLELSLVRGNNITLILDCSYAAIPSDAQKRADAPPDANPRQIFDPPKLSWGCDQDIYSRRVIYPRDQDIYSILTDPFIYLRQDIHSFGGHSFGSSLLDSYVLLAACSRHQLAYESQGEGLFTRELLKVLKEWPINKLSYKSLTDRLDMPAYQTPLLEGGHMNRCLFDSGGRTTDSSRILCHREKDQPYFTLYAGSNCRIISGSTFEIYRTDLTDDWRPFTTATVETVEAFISFLKPADQTIFTIHENHHVWYARFVTSPAPGFTIYCNNSNFLAQILDEGVGPWLVDPPSSVSNPLLADLCLTVDGSDVFYDLGDRNTRSLCSRSMNFSPRFPHTSSVHAIAEIRIIIDSYAHFTSRIMMPSPLPMAKLVTVEMKKVRPSGPFIQGFQKVYKPYSENLLPDAADKFVELGPFSDMQALIYYGFTVHNTSDDRLYVSLLAFKLSNLEIAHLFSSTTYLEPHSTHTFCDGDIDGLSYMFVIPEGLDENVIFLKFFVADEPINFDNLSQQPPLAEGRPIVREAWHPSTFGKRWASMTIPIINRRETLGNPEARDQGKME